MKPNEIKVDLEKRKKQVALVSAYSTLRNYINLLCAFFIVGVVSWTIFTSSSTSALSVFIGCLASAIIIFIAIVARDFALALIDSVDLQLLSNRRNALEREDSLTQKD